MTKIHRPFNAGKPKRDIEHKVIFRDTSQLLIESNEHDMVLRSSYSRDIFEIAMKA